MAKRLPSQFGSWPQSGHNNDWAMYMGWSNWDDARIAREGTKVSEPTARAIIDEAGYTLCGFPERSYRP